MEKWSLRREVKEFCGHFPVYRLEPFTPDSVTVVSGDDDTPVGTPVMSFSFVCLFVFFKGNTRGIS